MSEMRSGGVKGRVSLNNLQKVKRFFCRLISLYNQDKIDSQKFRDLIYGISKLGEIIKLSDFEQRLNEMEARIQAGGK